MTDKVNQERVESATQALRELMNVATKFDEIFKTLTLQEKYLVGGVVFRIRSIWNDFSLVGIMADPHLAREMIDTLVMFYQNPNAFRGMKNNPDQPVIKPATNDVKN